MENALCLLLRHYVIVLPVCGLINLAVKKHLNVTHVLCHSSANRSITIGYGPRHDSIVDIKRLEDSVEGHGRFLEKFMGAQELL